MKQARGEIKRLLVIMGEIQDLIGNAKGAYMNDRSRRGAEEVLNPLDRAFNLCVQAASPYYPVESEEE